MKLSTLEQKLYDILKDVAASIGLEIVKIKLSSGNRTVLDIAIDRLDGEHISITDCKHASNNFAAILDMDEDLIPASYSLEVGSAGVERPLVKIEDYKRFAGKVAMLKLHKAYNQSKKIQGEILGYEGDKVKIRVESIVKTKQDDVKENDPHKLHHSSVTKKGIQGESEEPECLRPGQSYDIDYNNIKSANLVFTQKMFKDSLSKNKK